MRRENEAMGGLLRRNLSRPAAANCLDPELLAAHFEHSLSAEESERCEAHLSSCARCREQLAAMVRADESLEAQAPEPQRSQAWLLDWRWLTSAAAVLAIVAVWTVRRSERIGKPPAQRSPLVAMTRQTGESNLPYPPRAPAPNAKKPAATMDENRIAHGKRLPPEERRQAEGAPESAESFAPTPPEEARPRGAAAADKPTNVPAQSRTGTGRGTEVVAREEAPRLPPPQPASSQRVLIEQDKAKELSAPTVETLSQAQPKTESAAAEVASSAEPNAPQPNANAAGAKSVGVVPPYHAADSLVARQTIQQGTSEQVISTPNGSVKWRITEAGFIERTENGGATWFGEEIDPGASLLAASAPHAKICWAVGRHGAVYVTKNGQTWKKVNEPSAADLVAVSAKNASSAVVTTAAGQRFSTRDGGKKWKQLPSSPASNQP